MADIAVYPAAASSLLSESVPGSNFAWSDHQYPPSTVEDACGATPAELLEIYDGMRSARDRAVRNHLLLPGLRRFSLVRRGPKLGPHDQLAAVDDPVAPG